MDSATLIDSLVSTVVKAYPNSKLHVSNLFDCIKVAIKHMHVLSGHIVWSIAAYSSKNGESWVVDLAQGCKAERL